MDSDEGHNVITLTYSACDAPKTPRKYSSATPVPPSPPWSPRSRVNEVGVSVFDRCEDESAGALPVVPSRSPRSGRRRGRRWVEAAAKSDPREVELSFVCGKYCSIRD